MGQCSKLFAVTNGKPRAFSEMNTERHSPKYLSAARADGNADLLSVFLFVAPILKDFNFVLFFHSGLRPDGAGGGNTWL